MRARARPSCADNPRALPSSGGKTWRPSRYPARRADAPGFADAHTATDTHTARNLVEGLPGSTDRLMSTLTIHRAGLPCGGEDPVREDPSMTKRTTEQQRARELQHTARAHGTELSYHEALNWVRATAEAQAENPGLIAVAAPHHHCVMLFPADEDLESIRRAVTPTPVAEVELANELLQRRNALMDNHSKTELMAMFLRRWRVSRADLARCTKQELANDLVQREDVRERYEAYGRVALINGRPARDSRPLCGGVGCSGHDSAMPWPETRARFRTQKPCIIAQ